MYSKSGKTKYTGIKFTSATIKIQSRTKAVSVIQFIEADAKLEIVKANQHSRLSANGYDLGRISQRDFKKLLDVLKHENHHYDRNSNSSQHSDGQNIPLPSEEENLSGYQQIDCEILPSESSDEQRVCDDLHRSSHTILPTYSHSQESYQGGSDSSLSVEREYGFEEKCYNFDRILTRRENSDNELERGIAELQRNCLSVRIGQQSLGEQQQEIKHIYQEGSSSTREQQQILMDKIGRIGESLSTSNSVKGCKTVRTKKTRAKVKTLHRYANRSKTQR